MKKKTKLKEKVENGSVSDSENGSEATATVINGEGRPEDECHEAFNGLDSNPTVPCDESDDKSAENGLEALSNGHAGEEVVEANGDASVTVAAEEDAVIENGENGSEEANTNGIAENGVEEGKYASFKVARWQNLIPSFPWIAPRWPILQRSGAEP